MEVAKVELKGIVIPCIFTEYSEEHCTEGRSDSHAGAKHTGIHS